MPPVFVILKTFHAGLVNFQFVLSQKPVQRGTQAYVDNLHGEIWIVTVLQIAGRHLVCFTSRQTRRAIGM